MKEASARIKINKLLEAAGWQFFADSNGPATIQLESNATIKTQDLDALGDDFEKITKGFPFIVLEAKSEEQDLTCRQGEGEDLRAYSELPICHSLHMNEHYFCDLERGNPHRITAFPKPDSVQGYQEIMPNPNRFIEETVGESYEEKCHL